MHSSLNILDKATWKVLNRYTVAGDYALAAFVIFPLVFYTALVGMHTQHAMPLALKATGTYFLSLILSTIAYRISPWHPLAAYPGPILWRLSSLVLVYASFSGKRHVVIDRLHKKYGKFVRIGMLTSFSFFLSLITYPCM
jgi:hypothetical protein